MEVTNTHNPELYNEDGKITVSKKWEDANNQDGIRPESVTIHVIGTADGKEVSNEEVVLPKDGKWEVTLENLPKNNNGKEITYTVTEDTVEGYTANIPTIANGKVEVTNTHNPELYNEDGKITVSKKWEDANNQDGIRPESVTIHVIGTADGKEVSNKEVTLPDENGNWEITIENLPKNNNGKEITYTVTEDTVEGYTADIPAIVNGKVEVINTHTPETIKIPITKVWEDYDNYFEARTPVTVEVKVGNSVKDTITLTSDKGWTGTSKELPKYENGELITYTVSEGAVEGYELKEITGNSTDGFTITNTYDNVTINKMVYQSTTTNTKEAKIDVVFVLDISGSMDLGNWKEVYNPRGYYNYVWEGNNRAKNAVAAINKAMKTIFDKNLENRVGIVTYSSDDLNNNPWGEIDPAPNAKVLLPLDSYVTKDSSSNYLSFTSKDDEKNDTITTNVKKVNANGTTTSVTNTTVTVKGGTYTQDGIKKGAELLTGAKDITYKIEGDDTEYTRAPVMIILTDGEPTLGNTTPDLYADFDGNGTAYNTSYGVGTIKTAAYYKEQIKNHYYPDEANGEAQIFTIGYDINDQYIKTILNPTSANIRDSKNSTEKDNTAKNRAHDLADKLGTTGKFTYANKEYNYSYADGSYVGNMDEAELNRIMADIVKNIKHYLPVQSFTTNIERNPALAELTNIDVNMKVTIKLDGISSEKTVEQWMSSDNNSVIEKHGDKYYVNLLAAGLKTAKLIDITYYEMEDSTTLNVTTKVFSAKSNLLKTIIDAVETEAEADKLISEIEESESKKSQKTTDTENTKNKDSEAKINLHEEAVNETETEKDDDKSNSNVKEDDKSQKSEETENTNKEVEEDKTEQEEKETKTSNEVNAESESVNVKTTQETNETEQE